MIGGVADWDALVRLAGVMAVALAVVTLMTRRERRSKDRAYDAAWKEVCHVLGEPHVHEGSVLRGTWEGRSFVATANEFCVDEHGGTVSVYRVSMTPARSGPAWEMKASNKWRLRAGRLRTLQSLLDAGLGRAVEEVMQTVAHVRAGARLSYEPRERAVVFEDGVGVPPCAQDFAAHLALVLRAVEITEALPAQPPDAVAGPIRPRLRVGTPPLLVVGGWFPAAIAGVAFGKAWPWAYGLLPMALLAPLVWRVRIGRP